MKETQVCLHTGSYEKYRAKGSYLFWTSLGEFWKWNKLRTKEKKTVSKMIRNWFSKRETFQERHIWRKNRKNRNRQAYAGTCSFRAGNGGWSGLIYDRWSAGRYCCSYPVWQGTGDHQVKSSHVRFTCRFSGRLDGHRRTTDTKANTHWGAPSVNAIIFGGKGLKTRWFTTHWRFLTWTRTHGCSWAWLLWSSWKIQYAWICRYVNILELNNGREDFSSIYLQGFQKSRTLLLIYT